MNPLSAPILLTSIFFMALGIWMIYLGFKIKRTWELQQGLVTPVNLASGDIPSKTCTVIIQDEND